MKHLNQFNEFHWDEFAAGKRFCVTGVSEWEDYDKHMFLGTKVHVYITEDKTTYPPGKNGMVMTNLGEKLTFKVSKSLRNITPGMFVVPVGVEASTYGEYNNQLTIRCDDIRTVTPAKE